MNAVIAETAISPPPRPDARPRPLMPIPAVMWRLDVDEDQVLRLIEDGELLWAFNLAAARATRRTIRVLSESVSDYLAGQVRTCGDNKAEAEWQRVASLVFPDKPVIVTCELARALSCGRDLAMNLVRKNHVRVVSGRRWRSGPGGSPRIDTASAKEWLKGRRIL
jgi:hypothetical protein